MEDDSDARFTAIVGEWKWSRVTYDDADEPEIIHDERLGPLPLVQLLQQLRAMPFKWNEWIDRSRGSFQSTVKKGQKFVVQGVASIDREDGKSLSYDELSDIEFHLRLEKNMTRNSDDFDRYDAFYSKAEHEEDMSDLMVMSVSAKTRKPIFWNGRQFVYDFMDARRYGTVEKAKLEMKKAARFAISGQACVVAFYGTSDEHVVASTLR